ncbi:uncharacterized protein LOC111376964, partial [Olea europaea var. sylvestris]|uniref:uncharacterized protein LOC111376964 n=1 Tax=Olea europaea var. sylvestris TaxID=158386 RepID=UPI000C1D0F89
KPKHSWGYVDPNQRSENNDFGSIFIAQIKLRELVSTGRRRLRDKAMSSRSYESDPDLEQEPARADQSELSPANFSTITTTAVVEAPIVELPSMPSQVEVKVESPISNVNVQVQQEVVEAPIVEITCKPRHAESSIPNANARQWEEMNNKRIWIYKAALKGDRNVRLDESARSLKITERGDRPLHMAAATKQTEFVRKLVECLDASELKLENIHGNTAFCFAATSGVVEIAKVMYQKNKELPSIPGSNGMTPIEMAVLMRKREMVEYLDSIASPINFKAEERVNIFVAAIGSGMYDIALKIFKTDRSIVTSPDVMRRALHELARKPFSDYGNSQEWICESFARIVPYVPCFKGIYGSIQKRRQAVQLLKELCAQIMTLKDTEISDLFEKTPILTDAAKTGSF